MFFLVIFSEPEKLDSSLLYFFPQKLQRSLGIRKLTLASVIAPDMVLKFHLGASFLTQRGCSLICTAIDLAQRNGELTIYVSSLILGGKLLGNFTLQLVMLRH